MTAASLFLSIIVFAAMSSELGLRRRSSNTVTQSISLNRAIVRRRGWNTNASFSTDLTQSSGMSRITGLRRVITIKTDLNVLNTCFVSF